MNTISLTYAYTLPRGIRREGAGERLASIRLCCCQCWYPLTGPTGLPSGDDRDCCSLFFHWENQCGAPSITGNDRITVRQVYSSM
ncbi:hypothetical protein GHT06_014047 [Daphnia sinensis]|uniref:Uncharacterized protein n=1 Tax=Daphnia sinensis TaxID=1820382 RepID=A0AAD5KT55_9CRUS|nr:hypothetical protein GHT06_014047 [Daphnia sinensis]